MERQKTKTEREKQVVSLMVALYCNKKHKQVQKHALCPECEALRDYAVARAESCPFKETKTFCSSCAVHCYSPDMRQRIKTVMRFSGPRMLAFHPVLALRHALTSRGEKRKGEKP